jgi:hypothetical protein
MNPLPTSVATVLSPTQVEVLSSAVVDPAVHMSGSQCSSFDSSPHGIEVEVQRRLQSHPALKFSRLHVHRCEAGICLEGFLESNEFELDLCDLVREVEGVRGVLNRVLLSRPGSVTAKKA